MRTNSLELKSWSLIISLGIFAASIITGLIAGGFLRSSGDTKAASANITISNNNQIITQDQSSATQTITKTSTVTVKDSSATAGYALSARLSQNTMPSSVVAISSSSASSSTSSTSCTPASPCTLTTTARHIFRTISDTATTTNGETTEWTVKITVPANTNLGNYILDIEYNEIANLPPGLVEGGNMQDATTAQCNALTAGSTLNLRDTRDGKIYKVKKMIDNNCWMIDNLAFQLNNVSAPTYSPAVALVSGSTTSVRTQAQYAANTAAYNTAAGQTTYLYNWCAALGDTSSNCSASANAVANNTVINGTLNTTGTTTSQPEVTGICPAPFRLPKGGPVATSSNAATTANEFAKLDIAMGGTGSGRDSANTYSLLMGATTANSSWSGALSGDYTSGLSDQGEIGFWLSSTGYSTLNAYILYLGNNASTVHPATNGSKNDGYAIRCIL